MADKPAVKKVLVKKPQEPTELQAQADREREARVAQEKEVEAQRATGDGPARPVDGISKLGKPALRASLEALAARLDRSITAAVPSEESILVAKELRKLAGN